MTTTTRRPRSGWRTRNGLKFKIKRATRRRTATYAWIIYKRPSAGRGERKNATRAGPTTIHGGDLQRTADVRTAAAAPHQFVFRVWSTIANKTNHETAFAACARKLITTV